MPSQFVQVWSDQMHQWEILHGPPSGLPSRRAPRLLLLVPGDGGTTTAQFGPLLDSDEGRNLVGFATFDYDAVVGVEFGATSHVDAARQLQATLQQWAHTDGIIVDAIAIGAGAQVLAQLGIPLGIVVLIAGGPHGIDQVVLQADEVHLLDPYPVPGDDWPADRHAIETIGRWLRIGHAEAEEAIGGDDAASPIVLGPPTMPSILPPPPAAPNGPHAPTMRPRPSLTPPPSLEPSSPSRSAGSGDGSDTPDDAEGPGRVVQAVAIHNDKIRQSFVAGHMNTLRTWIGPPPRNDEPIAAADQPVPELGQPVELTVELTVNGEVVGQQPLSLPKSVTSRSEDCDFEFDLPAGEIFVSGELAFTIGGRLYELVQFQADVVEANETERDGTMMRLKSRVSRRDLITAADLADRTEPAVTLVTGDDADGDDGTIRRFGTGHGAFDLTDKQALVSFLTEELYRTTKRLVRRQAEAAALTSPGPDVTDDDWLELLRAAAKHGWVLHRSLSLDGFTDPGDRIEIVNLSPNDYVPIEFLYDRGAPADDATVKPECIDAMAAGAADCGRCNAHADLTDSERDQHPTICPYGFWSLRKVIERHDVSSNGTIASPAPQEGDERVATAGRVLCGWSQKIRDEDVAVLKQEIASHTSLVDFVDDWSQWKMQLDQNPSLLVALPHHEDDDHQLGALEIGGDEFGLERALDQLVRTEASGAGPLLILLGCETDAAQAMGHPSFARLFNKMGAPVVIGTLSKVLGRHAVPFASKLVSELLAAGHDKRVGDVMLDVRRRMFADGYLMSLGVIALGDGDWKVQGAA